ncbi:MAG: hypothetical protein A4E32_02139 [Methanomassiliicoccales archaeon PtaU1.Bin124]|nr:MAG: hypothetical protein A4E32_02139 [Methanomassiliicoccales archaeon PtaU1.Bin124]
MTSGVAIYEAILADFTPVPTENVMLGAVVPATQLEGFEFAFLLSAMMMLIAFLAILFYQGKAAKAPL